MTYKPGGGLLHPMTPARQPLKVLVACEESQRVCRAFRDKGHEAYSCDLLPTRGNHPEWHIQDDVLKHLDDDWDLMIAFPPCKYICNGGNNWLNRRPDLAWRENRIKGADFFLKLATAWIPKIAIENPIGCMSSIYGKPDQIIRPWMFGHKYNKDVCLWLKNLQKLTPTNVVPGPYKKLDFWSTKRHKDGIDWKAVTFQGIAEAMAEQWGGAP